ncbi:hypothetical protein [Maridesulfovibrio bastinii]|uniref:hypothetical protein n=1 Tax=Maridesulfovibrio bastinii TaxID=47157 RepID=UPI0004119394|nr:hypothetical protein [Maridesulfovibrio bastinii]
MDDMFYPDSALFKSDDLLLSVFSDFFFSKLRLEAVYLASQQLESGYLRELFSNWRKEFSNSYIHIFQSAIDLCSRCEYLIQGFDSQLLDLAKNAGKNGAESSSKKVETYASGIEASFHDLLDNSQKIVDLPKKWLIDFKNELKVNAGILADYHPDMLIEKMSGMEGIVDDNRIFPERGHRSVFIFLGRADEFSAQCSYGGVLIFDAEIYGKQGEKLEAAVEKVFAGKQFNDEEYEIADIILVSVISEIGKFKKVLSDFIAIFNNYKLNFNEVFLTVKNYGTSQPHISSNLKLNDCIKQLKEINNNIQTMQNLSTGSAANTIVYYVTI